MVERFEDKLRALLIDLDNARTNGEAADIHERIGILMEDKGDALADAVDLLRSIVNDGRSSWTSAAERALARLDGAA